VQFQPEKTHSFIAVINLELKENLLFKRGNLSFIDKLELVLVCVWGLLRETPILFFFFYFVFTLTSSFFFTV